MRKVSNSPLRKVYPGEGGTAAEELSATGFVIYRTEEMENLVEWMRDYNASAAQGNDLRFYGFDMQRRTYSYDIGNSRCTDA